MDANRPSESFMVLPGMKPTYTTDPKHQGETRLPGCSRLSNRVRHMIVSMMGEFVGTYLFLFFAFAGTQVANTSPNTVDSPASTATLLYIALAFGFSLAVNVWIFFRISGGLFNPAVSVALALVGAIGWLKAGLLIISQILGAIAAAAMIQVLLPGDLVVRTTLNEGTSITRGLFIEMLLTAELVFCIFMLAAEKHKATFLAPIGIGLALFIAELAGVFYTGGSLNPARSFGPDVILATFDGYHWIYWVGPMLGAILAVLFYRLIKLLEYETANPGADSDGRELPVTQPLAEEPVHHHSRRHTNETDGIAESDFAPAFPPINKPLPSQPSASSRREATNTTTDTAVASESYSMPSYPSKPSATFRHGGDGQNSEDSYRRAPSVETGSSAYSSRHSS